MNYPDGEELIRSGGADSWHFCKHCELEKTCERENMPRILKATSFVIQKASELDYRFGSLPYKGGLRDQPIWFQSMFSHYQKVKSAVIREMEKANVKK